VPCAARSLAGIAAVSWVLLTKAVVRLLPFHCTTELGTKLEPFTVRVKADPLAEVVEGDREVTLGTGLFTVNARAFEVPSPEPGLKAVTWAVPPAATSPEGIAAVSWLPPTNVVERLLPFHCTTELEMKPEPFSVREKPAPPAVALDGEIEVIEGMGLGGGVLVPPPPPHPARLNAAATIRRP
jgi:hypothetical protein